MSLDGIWSTGLYGLFGWETTGILVFEKGRAIGGGNNHYSVGRYEESGDSVHISLLYDYYGTPRTIFGAADKNISVSIDGKHKDGAIEGEISRTDKPAQTVAYRLTRLAELP